MSRLEFCLLTFALVGLVLGSWGILWARNGHAHQLVFWGQSLFVGTMLFLGASALVAASHRAEGLAPIGLVAGLLVVGMLWEMPSPHLAQSGKITLPEEA